MFKGILWRQAKSKETIIADTLKEYLLRSFLQRKPLKNSSSERGAKIIICRPSRVNKVGLSRVRNIFRMGLRNGFVPIFSKKKLFNTNAPIIIGRRAVYIFSRGKSCIPFKESPRCQAGINFNRITITATSRMRFKRITKLTGFISPLYL